MTDYHSHCLFGIDDGAGSLEESVLLLEMLKKQGADCVCLTSHFFPDTNLNDFLKTREEHFFKIKEAIKDKDAPKLVLGAEVAVFKGVSKVPGIAKLCYGNTKYMLLELPETGYLPWMSDEIDSLVAKYKIKPVIAHIERCLPYYNKDFFELFEFEDVVFQLSTAVLQSFGMRQRVKALLKSGRSFIFGSDAHNTKRRAPTFDLLKKYIKEKNITDIDLH